MNVLILSPYPDAILPAIEAAGDDYTLWTEPLNAEILDKTKADTIVSYGYRHIISQSWLAALSCPVVNLHISLLPWNRGADPNFWSWFDATPKGVSIHEIDAGIDTGDVLVQEETTFPSDATLRTSYTALQTHITDLFIRRWRDIRSATVTPRAQEGAGSYHRKADLSAYQDLLDPLGMDTPVDVIARAGRQAREAASCR